MNSSFYTVEANAQIQIDDVNTSVTNQYAFQLEENAWLRMHSVQVDVNLAPSHNAALTAESGADITITNIAAQSPQYTELGTDSASSLTYIAQPDQIPLMAETVFYFMDEETRGGVIRVVLPADSYQVPTFTVSNLQASDSLVVQFQDEDNIPFGTETCQIITHDDGSKTVELYLPDSVGYKLGARIALINIDPDMEVSLSSNGKIAIACYLRDTLIATPNGQKPVQDLQAGDLIMTANGNTATVKWLGHRKMLASRITTDNAINAFPIKIAAGALSPNTPTRDLYVSPGHHLYFDGMLVPAVLLVNGKTITQDFTRRSFEYFHVELDRFDIMLAEGAAAESYVDTGNRSMFQNVQVSTLEADFGPAAGRQPVEGIEIVRKGPKLETLRKRLLRRAAARSQSNRVTDSNLHIEVNGQAIYPEPSDQKTHVMRFVLPENSQGADLYILSRSSIARETSYSAHRDTRRIGVGLAGIAIEDNQGKRNVCLTDHRLQGLHAIQEYKGTPMRWTKGKSTIPAAALNMQGNTVLELHVLRTYAYWDDATLLAA
jgi:hypothetical protein